MSKVVVFDFVSDTAVAVAADLGTDPNDQYLRQEAIQKLIQQLFLKVHSQKNNKVNRQNAKSP